MKRNTVLVLLVGLILCSSFCYLPHLFKTNPISSPPKTPQKNVSNPPALEGSWVKSYFWFNGMTNLTWDFALNDVTHSQESGTENGFLDNGADNYGYAQEQVSFTVPLNSHIEIKITEVEDGGDPTWHGSMQMHIGGVWVYDLLVWDWDNATTIYLTANMSAYTGDTVLWHMYNLHDGSQGNSRYTLDYFAWFTYSYEAVWNDVLDEVVFQMQTPPTPTWYDVLDESVFTIQAEYFVGNIHIFVSLLGFIMIPLAPSFIAVKHKQKTLKYDDLCIATIIFFLGWALFLGGAFG